MTFITYRPVQKSQTGSKFPDCVEASIVTIADRPVDQRSGDRPRLLDPVARIEPREGFVQMTTSRITRTLRTLFIVDGRSQFNPELSRDKVSIR